MGRGIGTPSLLSLLSILSYVLEQRLGPHVVTHVAGTRELDNCVRQQDRQSIEFSPRAIEQHRGDVAARGVPSLEGHK